MVRLARNFGHQLAVSAGLEHAAGDAVVIIDADLQDPPEVIPEMVARWRDGYHVVYGMRTDRPGETAFKLWTAKLSTALSIVFRRCRYHLTSATFVCSTAAWLTCCFQCPSAIVFCAAW